MEVQPSAPSEPVCPVGVMLLVWAGETVVLLAAVVPAAAPSEPPRAALVPWPAAHALEPLRKTQRSEYEAGRGGAQAPSVSPPVALRHRGLQEAVAVLLAPVPPVLRASALQALRAPVMEVATTG